MGQPDFPEVCEGGPVDLVPADKKANIDLHSPAAGKDHDHVTGVPRLLASSSFSMSSFWDGNSLSLTLDMMSPGATVLITSGSFSLISSVWTWIQGIFLTTSRSDVLVSARLMINSSFTSLSERTFWTCRWRTPVNPQTPRWAASARPTRYGWSLNPQEALKDKPPTQMWLCGSGGEAKAFVLLPKYCRLLPLRCVIYQELAQCEELLSAWYPLRVLPKKL